MTWQIRHAGPGWIASNSDGTGAYFPKWEEALAFVERRTREQWTRDLEDTDTLMWRGMVKAASRGVRPPVAPRPKPITEQEVRAAQAMRTNGRTWVAIGDILDRSPTSIQSAVWRAEHPLGLHTSPDDVKPTP